MEWENFEKRRWNLFCHIIDKQDLDLKGESIKDYASNFKSAFHKADNITKWYSRYSEEILGE